MMMLNAIKKVCTVIIGCESPRFRPNSVDTSVKNIRLLITSPPISIVSLKRPIVLGECVSFIARPSAEIPCIVPNVNTKKKQKRRASDNVNASDARPAEAGG
jgi:hypothetical protein